MEQHQMINHPLSVAERLDAHTVASNLSNNATRLCKEGHDTDALMLYARSLNLLKEASPVSATSSSAAQKGNGRGCVLAKDEAACSSFTEVRNFAEPLLIPIDDGAHQGASKEQRDSMRAICGDNIVALIVIYNMGILFMKNNKKHLASAIKFLDLVHLLLHTNVVDPQTLHPTFRVAIAYNFALASINCYGGTDAGDVWKIIIEAADMCNLYLSDHHPLFVVLFSQMGGVLMNCGDIEGAQEFYNIAVAGFNRRLMGNESEQFALCETSAAAAA
jgi:hypothetical protein